MSNQKEVADFMRKAGQEVATELTLDIDDKTCILKAKLLLEETLEAIYALGVDVNLDFNKTNARVKTTDDVSLSKTREIDIVEIADGVADVDYVNMGIANTFGFNHQDVFDEVHRSNMSKFIDGHRKANQGRST